MLLHSSILNRHYKWWLSQMHILTTRANYLICLPNYTAVREIWMFNCTALQHGPRCVTQVIWRQVAVNRRTKPEAEWFAKLNPATDQLIDMNVALIITHTQLKNTSPRLNVACMSKVSVALAASAQPRWHPLANVHEFISRGSSLPPYCTYLQSFNFRSTALLRYHLITQPLGSEKPRFFKQPNPLGFGLLLDFLDFYLNKQLGSLLVDFAHQLSFYLYSPVLKNLQIHYLLVVRSCKHKEIFNYYWNDKLKLN